jgi:hypothetical protein
VLDLALVRQPWLAGLRQAGGVALAAHLALTQGIDRRFLEQHLDRAGHVALELLEERGPQIDALILGQAVEIAGGDRLGLLRSAVGIRARCARLWRGRWAGLVRCVRP